MTYTTAFYRREAQAEEKVLNWFRASLLWRKAISVHPGPANSPLAQADIANMRRRAESCERMNKQETAQ